MLAHVKYLWAVLTVVGLALAGCGGSDSDDGDGATTTPPATTSGLQNVTLPTGTTINLGTDRNLVGTIGADTTNFSIPGTNLSVTCPATVTAGCQYEVTRSSVRLSGGVTPVLTSSLPNPNVGTSPSDPAANTGTTSYRSTASLLNVFQNTGTTMLKSAGIDKSNDGNDFRPKNASDTKTNIGGTAPTGVWAPFHLTDKRSDGIPTAASEEFFLATNIDVVTDTLPDADYIIYGAWMKNPRNNAGTFEPIYGGKVAYDKTEIRTTGASARYSGNALIRHRQRAGRANLADDWSLTHGTVELQATFTDGKIQGLIDTGATWDIKLAKTDLGSQGTATIVTATTEVAEAQATAVTSPVTFGTGQLISQGTWKGNLFGIKDPEPNAVAGEFTTSAGTRVAPTTVTGGTRTFTETPTTVAFVEAHGTFGAEEK